MPVKRGDAVTLEEVQRAVHKLRGLGKRVDLRGVHAEVGRGSRSTIHKHVKTLRDGAEPSAQSVGVQPLSAQLAKVLADELERLVGARTSNLAASLEDAQASLDVVSDEAADLRNQVDESRSLVEATRESLSQQFGLAAALRAQVDELSEERSALRQQLALAERSFAVATERANASEAACRRIVSDGARVSEELTEVRRQGALSRDQLEVERLEVARLRAELAAATSTAEQLVRTTESVRLLQGGLSETQRLLAASEAEKEALVARLDEAKRVLAATEARLQRVLDKVLEAPGPLGAASSCQACEVPNSKPVRQPGGR